MSGGAVQVALALLQSEQAQIQAQRQVFKGTRRTHQIDGEADARLVKDGQGRSIVDYNVQSAVDSKHKLIVHHEVVCEGNDLRQLLPMAQAVKQVLEQTRLCVVADAGYSNGENLPRVKPMGSSPMLLWPVQSILVAMATCLIGGVLPMINSAINSSAPQVPRWCANKSIALIASPFTQAWRAKDVASNHNARRLRNALSAVTLMRTALPERRRD